MGAHDHDHGHTHDHVHLGEADWAAMADQAALEGELLLGFVTGAAAWAAELRGPAAPPVARILDLGSGPGVGTCELARLFPEAEVIAVDGSPAMLERAAERARVHGVDDRVRTHLAELPGGVVGLPPADLLWASMSLHHVGDEVGVLRALRPVLSAGGLLAIAELADPMRFLPDDLGLGRPGLGGRLEGAGASWFAAMRHGLPDAVASSDLSSMLVEAGYDVLGAEVRTEHVEAPLPDGARQVVLGKLRRQRDQVDGLDEDDLRTLDVLLDPNDPRGLLHRDDLFVTASRQLAVARPI
ncbi:MAG: rebM4 [Actinomycetia bacterium]|nr:rebM4 [Actinomycetes bacterium]